MKKVILLSFGLIVSLLATGCAKLGLSVVNTWARIGDYERIESLPYSEGKLQQLDIYRPTNTPKDAKLPVVVFFYGGCWGGCNTYPKADYRFVAEALTSAGYLAIIADYRLYPTVLIDDILRDGAAATAWAQRQASQYGGDANNIYLMGHSAGAHIAAMLAFDEQWLASDVADSIRGFIGLAGPYDFLPLTEDYQRSLFGPPSHYPATQPINFVDGNEAAALLLWGEADDTVYRHNLENMAAKIRAKGGQVDSATFPELDHVGILSALARPLRSGKPVLPSITAFIEAQSANNP